jgi:hypothetical protein
MQPRGGRGGAGATKRKTPAPSTKEVEVVEPEDAGAAVDPHAPVVFSKASISRLVKNALQDSPVGVAPRDYSAHSSSMWR